MDILKFLTNYSHRAAQIIKLCYRRTRKLWNLQKIVA